MITKFKIFENINRRLEIGDFAFTDKRYSNSFCEIKPYEIGKLYTISGGQHLWFIFSNDRKICLDTKDIVAWSDSKEDLETKISSLKYNL